MSQKSQTYHFPVQNLTVSRGWTKGVDIGSMRAEENFSKFQPHQKDLRSVWEMRRLKTQWDKNRYDLPRDRSLAIIRMILIHRFHSTQTIPQNPSKSEVEKLLKSCRNSQAFASSYECSKSYTALTPLTRLTLWRTFEALYMIKLTPYGCGAHSNSLAQKNRMVE